ncbi:Zinc finger Mcm10/DnaG-type [Arabidopsis thaliana x Arabidopsis arenosa]|uniref:Zinc finger Mcm10/DnaG-type n=1 Tax=Arabidopsis thaliana x Arabidopsis arenosa TaxID=1240361 RepID=A0A8T2A530_9BRAS|nr:Zinc finger Mcm10/DnaG-type [Arabidopsis thaliana x Arabidopsis arenosa]
MENDQEDLDLLLSLDDRVLETPPGSPSAAPGYLTDDESPKRRGHSDLSDFRSVVQDCIDYDPKPVAKNTKPKGSNNSNANDIDKFSGLRIRNQLLSPAEISDLFSDIRFVRLPTIKNLLMGDKLSGCWATMGVLTEKGQPKTSSIGQPYGIWKIGSLNENTVSLFLFGDAYKKNETEKAGTVFGLLNCSVRKDKGGREFSLSVNSAKQMVKLGVSADYGVCTAKRKDGTTCTSVVNKRQGAFCKIHKLNASDKFATMRTELKGGNLRTAFRDPKSQGIYTVEPPADRSGNKKANQPVRVLSVEGLRKALSGADKVTPNVHSQGIRFLNEMTSMLLPSHLHNTN